MRCRTNVDITAYTPNAAIKLAIVANAATMSALNRGCDSSRAIIWSKDERLITAPGPATSSTTRRISERNGGRPSRPRTTIIESDWAGRCAHGTKTTDLVTPSSRYLVSRATPTTSYHGDGEFAPPNLSLFPTGSFPGHARRARPSEMTTTGGVP